MATKVLLRNTYSDMHRGDQSQNLDATSPTRWMPKATSTTQGAGPVTAYTLSTVTGPTAGVELQESGISAEWISPPLSQAVTIAGAITCNVWMSETTMSGNVGAQVVIERLGSTGAIISTILNSESGVEVAVGTRAVNNWAPTPTSTAMLKGDRFRIRVAGNDIGTMAAGPAFDFSFDNAALADGDSWVTFTETLAFITSTPAGSVLFLTDTASDVSAGITERELWTGRGAGVQTDVTNTVTGPTAGVQVTDTAGGAAVEWYTKQLQAFTLAGPVSVNMRALTSNALSQASLRVEIATCAADGTGAVVWASGCTNNADALGGRVTTSEIAFTCRLAGADVALTDGQRLRLRVYLDDYGFGILITGHTVTTHYAGTSGGASGDSFITLSQTVAEFVAAGGIPNVVMAPPIAR